MKKVRGVVYGDGTVFLYRALPSISCKVIFTAAILHPNDLAWTVLMKRLELSGRHYVMYHDGKVLVSAGDSLGCACVLMMMKFEANNSDNGSSLESTWDIKRDICYSHECSYIVESHGELLLATVLVSDRCYNRYTCSDLARMLRLKIRVMQKEPSSGKIQWVERDNRDLSDHMLFLGSPTSFASKLDEGK